MERSHRVLETIKTILIVVLTLSAVLLLSFYWANLSLDALFAKRPTNDTPNETPDAPKTREIIAPAEISLNLEGEPGGSFAVLFPEEYDAWQIVTTSFAAFSRSEGASLEETTGASYDALLGARSVRVAFGYSLPFDGFCKQFGIASAPFGAIGAMDELVWSEASPDSLFLSDRTAGTWYRLIGSAETLEALSDLIRTVSESETDPSYTVRTMLGENNSALVPLGRTEPLRTASADKEFHIEKRDVEADRFARTFFDNSLDFVRRVKDSKGLLTYIYNYSQKILTVSPVGIAEYKEELAEAAVSQGFYASLGTALSFVADHGGWYPALTVDGEPDADGLTPLLCRAEAISSGNRSGYRYTFGFRAGHETLYCEEASIVIDVYDGQVTYYRRAMITGLSLSTSGNARDACSPANAIAGNSDWAYEALAASGAVPVGIPEEERFAYVALALRHVKAGYLMSFAEEADTISAVPVWTVGAENVLLFFDLVSGEPVTYGVNAQ